MNQCRFSLRKNFTIGRSNGIDQRNIIQVTAIGDRADITGYRDGGQNGNRLPDSSQNCLAASPLDIVHVVICISDHRLKINHLLSHIQLFHQDGSHVFKPVRFVVINSHIHQTLGTDRQTLIIIIDVP